MDTEVINSIVEYCNDKWDHPNDDRCQNFENTINDFLDEFETDTKDLIISLIKEIDYYSHHKVNSSLIELHEKLLQTEGFCPENTFYCVLQSQTGRMNSGVEYLFEYARLNKISKHYVYIDLKKIDDYLQYLEYIVFVDDFCGSGKTLTDYIDENYEYLKNVTIVYIVIHIMQDSLSVINEYASRKGITIIILYLKQTQRAFVNRISDIQKFENASINLGITDEKNGIWGFNKTEALVSYYNNTPNNTLGIFRITTSKNKAIFPRINEKRPSIQTMKSNRERRKKSNYNLEVRNNAR